MKKILSILLVLIMLTGCNKKIIDLKWHYNKALILLGDEVIEVDISTWNDYEDSDMVEIQAKDGTTYYTHGSNIVLISE